jgi:hypothetical protein
MNLNALTDEGIEIILKAVHQNQTLTYVSLQVKGRVKMELYILYLFNN